MAPDAKQDLHDGKAANLARVEEEPASEGSTSRTVDEQTFRAYRRFCFWLGHFFATLTLVRLLVRPSEPYRGLVLESFVLMLLVYGTGLFLARLATWLGDLENVGLWVVGIILLNNALLVKWFPQDSQLFNFLLVQVATGVAFRSLWRFITIQVLCLLVASASFIHWISLKALAPYAFEFVESVLLGALIWVYFNRLVLALARLRAKDKLILRQRRRLIVDLRSALSSVRVLRGLIPICAHCKRVRDDRGFWQQVEAYIDANTEAKFSHGICPACMVDVSEDLRRMRATWAPKNPG